MLKEDSYTSSKLQSFYNEELLHPQDLQRKMDDIINKRDKVVDEAINVSTGINLSNNISVDSLRSIAKEFYKFKSYKSRPGICRSICVLYNGLYKMIDKNFKFTDTKIEITYNEDVFRNPYWDLFNSVNGMISGYTEPSYFGDYIYPLGTRYEFGGNSRIIMGQGDHLGNYIYTDNFGDEFKLGSYLLEYNYHVPDIPFFSIDGNDVRHNINRSIDLRKDFTINDFTVYKSKMPFMYQISSDLYDRPNNTGIPVIQNSDHRTGTFAKVEGKNIFFFLDVVQLDYNEHYTSLPTPNGANLYAVWVEFDGTGPVLKSTLIGIDNSFRNFTVGPYTNRHDLFYTKTENGITISGRLHYYQHNVMMSVISDGDYCDICVWVCLPDASRNYNVPQTDVIICRFDCINKRFIIENETMLTTFSYLFLVGVNFTFVSPEVDKFVGMVETCYTVKWSQFIKEYKQFINSNPMMSYNINFYSNCYYNIFSGEAPYPKPDIFYQNPSGIGKSTYMVGPVYNFGEFPSVTIDSRDFNIGVDDVDWETDNVGDYIVPLKASFITLYNIAVSLYHGRENFSIPAMAYHVQTTPYIDEDDPNWSGRTLNHCRDRIYLACYVDDELYLLVNWRTQNSKSYDSAVVIPIINKTRLTNDKVLRKNMTDSNKIIFYEDSSKNTIWFTNDSPFKYTIKNINSKHTHIKDIVCEVEYVLPDRTDLSFRLYACKWNGLFLPVTYGRTYDSFDGKYVEPACQFNNVAIYTFFNDIMYSDINGEIYFLFDKLMKDLSIFTTFGENIADIIYDSLPNSGLVARIEIYHTRNVTEYDFFEMETLDGIHWYPIVYQPRNIWYNNFSSLISGNGLNGDQKIFMPNAFIDINRKGIVRKADGSTEPISLDVDSSGIGFFGGVDVQRLPFYMVFDQSTINGPIIASGIPSKAYKDFFGIPYKNRPIYELALVLLNKLEAPIIPFLFYGDDLFVKDRQVTVDDLYGNVKTRLHVYCPTELVAYYTSNKDSLFRKCRDDQDMEIEIVDINLLKQNPPSEITTIDDLRNDSYFVERDGNGDNIKFRNYFDKRYFHTRMSFDEKCKVLEVYPLYENKSYDNDRYVITTDVLKYHLKFGPKPVINIKFNDRLNGSIELNIERIGKDVSVVSRTGDIHGCVYFTDPEYPIVTTANRATDFFVKFYRDKDGSMVDGDTVFWDAEIEINNVEDSKYRIVSLSDEQIKLDNTAAVQGGPTDLSNSVFVHSYDCGSYIDTETPYNDKTMLKSNLTYRSLIFIDMTERLNVTKVKF